MTRRKMRDVGLNSNWFHFQGRSRVTVSSIYLTLVRKSLLTKDMFIIGWAEGRAGHCPMAWAQYLQGKETFLIYRKVSGPLYGSHMATMCGLNKDPCVSAFFGPLP